MRHGFTAPTLPTLPNSPVSNGLITTPAWATGGGNIVVSAGRDIIGIETPTDTGNQYSSDGSSAGVSTGEFWSAWYYVNGKSTGSATAPFDPSAGGVQYSSYINYGTFFQGFGALGGGNITLQAGRNVQDVSASLPETIQYSGGLSASGPAATAHYYGGGNLLVEAGNDVLSGVYYVGRGTGTIRAGGNVVSDATLYQTYANSSNSNLSISDYSGKQDQFSVPLLLAVQDGYISVQAAGSIDLGGIFQPTQIRADLTRNILARTYTQSGVAQTLPSAIGASFDSYGPSSGVSLTSQSGSIAIDSLRQSDGTGSGFHRHAVHPRQGQPRLCCRRRSIQCHRPEPRRRRAKRRHRSCGLFHQHGCADRALCLAGEHAEPHCRRLGQRVFRLGLCQRQADAQRRQRHTGAHLCRSGHQKRRLHPVGTGPAVGGARYRRCRFTGQNNAADDITSIVAGRDILADRCPISSASLASAEAPASISTARATS